MILVLSMGFASAADVCHWETSWTNCKGNDAGRVCEPVRFDGTEPTDAEARHACYEARAVPAAVGWTKESMVDCAIQCGPGAPLALPTITLQEGAAPELRAALYRTRNALAECVAGMATRPKQVTVSANIANGNVRVTRVEGVIPTVGECLTAALHGTVQAGPDAGTTITLRWAATPAP